MTPDFARWVIEAWLLGTHAPKEVMAALDCVVQQSAGLPVSSDTWLTARSSQLSQRRGGRKPRMGLECLEQVRQLVQEGLSDVEIGKHFGVGSQAVANFRNRHGMKKRGLFQVKAVPTVAPAPSTPEVYTDEQGQKITRLPPGYARGAEPSISGDGFSAKPRRS